MLFSFSSACKFEQFLCYSLLFQPKLFTSELLDLVASHFKLKEKQYFGLAYVDEL
jgi:hypothetical protein